MNVDEFNEIVDSQLSACRDMLVVKAAEYATDDRLHNFRQAAHLNQQTMAKALSGMMLKHTVSIYDLVNRKGPVSTALWNEKITDHINYLILLKAVVSETNSQETHGS